MVCSHFLEENSLTAERLLHDIQLQQATKQGISRYSSVTIENKTQNHEKIAYSFDLFVCLAMIYLFRSCLFDAEDELEALEGIQKRQKTLDVREVLSMAEQLFKLYFRNITTISSAVSPSTSPYDIID